MNEVTNNCPWMVNNKPLFVQEWNVDVCLDRTEPRKLLVLVKLLNVPMEAWSVKGISALLSFLGKPIIMDDMTAKMCMSMVGRIGYARILVEIDAEKEIKDKIEIFYRGISIISGKTKEIEAEYAWRSPVCTHCKEFDHVD